MLKYAKSPKRSIANISDSSQVGYNGYYRSGEKVDDLETIQNVHHKNVHASDARNSFVNLTEETDIEEDLEGISMSSLSNLSEFSIDWSEHNKTAKAVWIRRTRLTSDLNQAKERIRAREAEQSLCNKSKQNKVGNDQNKQNDSEHPMKNNPVKQKHVGVNEESSSSSSSSSNICSSSSSKQNNVHETYLSDNLDYNERATYSPTNNLKAASVDVDNPSKKNKRKYGVLKRNTLVIAGFVLMFILIIALIILAAKMGQVQETVKYIEDIFTDNVTFAETFSRFDEEQVM